MTVYEIRMSAEIDDNEWPKTKNDENAMFSYNNTYLWLKR